jgi:cyclopropane-fatty-acyl-phospholipid synthase
MGVVAARPSPHSTGTAGFGAPAGWLDRAAARLIAERLRGIPLELRLWDGTIVAAHGPEPVRWSIGVRDRRTLYGLCLDPQYQFGEGYARGTVTVDGPLPGLLEAIYRSYPIDRAGLLAEGRQAFGTNTSARSRANVHHHYDLGEDFYRLWLDRDLLYTCAYYAESSQSLDEAQQAKMEHVCRKLDLRPGDRVVEAGAGWGALAIYMARTRGVRVTAYNVSVPQVRYARARAHEAGVADLVEFVEDDYRAIAGEFDVFVSIGMLEHVGRPLLPLVGDLVDRVLARPDGRGLLHFIGRTYPAPLSRWIRARVFPGAYPPALAEVIDQVLGPHDLAVVDVENLRHHYSRTLAEWLRRYDSSEAAVARMYGPEFVRVWRLYLAGSQAAFDAGSLQLFQIQFARGSSTRRWWTRAALYRDGC